jgi:hypothetical protein
MGYVSISPFHQTDRMRIKGMLQQKEYSRAVIRDMRNWLEDCFEDMPSDVTKNEIVHAVARHYSGGIKQFLSDAL